MQLKNVEKILMAHDGENANGKSSRRAKSEMNRGKVRTRKAAIVICGSHQDSEREKII